MSIENKKLWISFLASLEVFPKMLTIQNKKSDQACIASCPTCRQRQFWISNFFTIRSTDFTLKGSPKIITARYKRWNWENFLKGCTFLLGNFPNFTLQFAVWQFLDFPSKWNWWVKWMKNVNIQNHLAYIVNGTFCM